MARFRFRAGAALDLRKQQEDQAAAILARTEAILRRIAADLASAEATQAEAQAAASSATRAGTDAAALEWHRNWILRLSMNVSRLSQEQLRQRQLVASAEAVWREARRKRLALERMRDRARRRFESEQARIEMKTIDELARLRFLATAGSGSEES